MTAFDVLSLHFEDLSCYTKIRYAPKVEKFSRNVEDLTLNQGFHLLHNLYFTLINYFCGNPQKKSHGLRNNDILTRKFKRKAKYRPYETGPGSILHDWMTFDLRTVEILNLVIPYGPLCILYI
jgi:hypothetical protein